MTSEEKDIIIARMLENPALLTDAEISMILEDDELRDIYSMAVEVKHAMRKDIEIDPHREWQLLAPRLPRRGHSHIQKIVRIAAILTGIFLVSAIFFNIYKGSRTEEGQQLAGMETEYNNYAEVNIPALKATAGNIVHSFSVYNPNKSETKTGIFIPGNTRENNEDMYKGGVYAGGHNNFSQIYNLVTIFDSDDAGRIYSVLSNTHPSTLSIILLSMVL